MTNLRNYDDEGFALNYLGERIIDAKARLEAAKNGSHTLGPWVWEEYSEADHLLSLTTRLICGYEHYGPTLETEDGRTTVLSSWGYDGDCVAHRCGP